MSFLVYQLLFLVILSSAVLVPMQWVQWVTAGSEHETFVLWNGGSWESACQMDGKWKKKHTAIFLVSIFSHIWHGEVLRVKSQHQKQLYCVSECGVYSRALALSALESGNHRRLPGKPLTPLSIALLRVPFWRLKSQVWTKRRGSK